MISKPLKIALVALLLAAGGAAIGFLHLSNAQLRQRIATLQQRNQMVTRLRSGNAELKDTLARSQGDDAAAREAIHADVIRARAELAEWEKRATERNQQLTAKTAAESAALDANRDPRTGLTRLEHFQNLGQAAPANAFQTLVWAALKGDDARLGQVSVVSDPARAKAEALIARLPEGARAQWTPEKLAAMFFMGAFGEVTAAQVLAENTKDPQHVTLSVRLVGSGKEASLPLMAQLGTNGWQVVFDEKMLGAVQKKIANVERPPPKE